MILHFLVVILEQDFRLMPVNITSSSVDKFLNHDSVYFRVKKLVYVEKFGLLDRLDNYGWFFGINFFPHWMRKRGDFHFYETVNRESSKPI